MQPQTIAEDDAKIDHFAADSVKFEVAVRCYSRLLRTIIMFDMRERMPVTHPNLRDSSTQHASRFRYINDKARAENGHPLRLHALDLARRLNLRLGSSLAYSSQVHVTMCGYTAYRTGVTRLALYRSIQSY
jgi:hypothetical protein